MTMASARPTAVLRYGVPALILAVVGVSLRLVDARCFDLLAVLVAMAFTTATLWSLLGWGLLGWRLAARRSDRTLLAAGILVLVPGVWGALWWPTSAVVEALG